MVKEPRTRREVRDAERKFRTSLQFARTAFAKELKADRCPEAQNIEDIEILGFVGQGVYGVVYKARHPEYGIVAIKEQIFAFMAIKEKRYLHAFDNKFILKGIAHFRDRNRLYLITAFAPYGSYRRIMHYNEESTVKIFYAQIARGLQYLHHADITHGDCHPGNILVFKGGHLKLADFGLAEEGQDGLLTYIGNGKYIPPEMILGRSHDCTADWWAFGTMMYEQLLGRHPYCRGDENYETVHAQLRDIMTRPLEALKSNLDGISPEAQDLIRKTMEPDPARRAGSNAESIQAILDHTWFNDITFGLLLNEQSHLPQFDHVKLNELEVKECRFRTIADIRAAETAGTY